MRQAGIVDPAKVERVALENAASIAGLFLTTECIVNTILLLLHLNIRVSTYIKDSYTTGELSQTLLKFLLII